MKYKNLTKREYQIMSIFWNSDSPLTANDIQKLFPEKLSIYAIQHPISKLLQNNFINDNIIKRGRNFMREYTPNISQSEYISSITNDKTTYDLALNFIKNCDDIHTINTLEKLINEKKAKL